MKFPFLLSTASLLASATLGHAAVVISFTGGTLAADYAPSAASSGLTVSNLSAGADLTGFVANAAGASGAGYRAYNWTTANAASVDSALAFTVTVQPGYTAQLSAVGFDFRPQGSGPQNVSVSVDLPVSGRVQYPGATPMAYPGYADETESYVAWASFSATGNVSLSAGQSATVYIHGYNARNPGKELILDTILIDGSVTSIPEPATLGLVLGLAGVGLVGLRRFRR